MADKEIKVKIKASDETKGTLDTISANISKTFEAASTAVKAFLAAFVVDKIAGFFKSAVDESQKAETAFKQVGNALRNIGVDAAAVRPHIEAMVRALSDKTGLETDDITAAFTVVLRRTGDYKKALGELPEVLDVAAAKQIEVADAAKLVAKAHEGNAKAIKEVQNTQGAAADQNTGYAKTLNQIHNAWKDVLQSLGDAITRGDGVTRSGNKLVDMLKDVSTWIEDHHKEIQEFRDDLLSIAGAIGSVVGWLAKGKNELKEFGTTILSALTGVDSDLVKGVIRALQHKNDNGFSGNAGAGASFGPPDKGDKPDYEDASKEIAQQIEDYKELESLHEIDSKTWGEVIALQNQLAEKLEAGNLTLHERATLLKQIGELEKISAERLKVFNQGNTVLAPSVTSNGAEPIQHPGPSFAGLPAPHDLGTDDYNAKLVEREKILRNVAYAADQVGDAIVNAFSAIGSGDNVWHAFGQAAKKGISEVASQLAKMEVGKGVADLAEGSWPPNPVAIAAAAKHFAAAALFGAIGGAASGGGGGGGGYSGGRDYGRLNSDAAALSPTAATITINGGILDMSDPRQSDALASALGQLTSRRIIINQG